MKLLFLILVLIYSRDQIPAQESKPVVYLIPGQGADYREFKNLEIDSRFDTAYVHYFTPEKGLAIKDYAKALSKQIDTSRTFYLVGVSLGGMLATEMGDFLHPEKIILISSAKSRKELPGRYTFQQTIPVYKLVPPGVIKLGAKIMQPIVEPDRKHEKETCITMLRDKDPLFLKRTVKMIMEWERVNYRDDIAHIHGDNDHTIPARNVKYNHLVKNGSHMMVLTRGDEISVLINKILQEY
ncbi:MAG: alpha/beta hydrolase [Bacteroidota bacterium]